MKIKVVLLTFIIIILLFVVIFIIIQNKTTSVNEINYTIPINNTNSTTIILSSVPGDNSTLVIPSNDYVINNINWSMCPNLQVGYVYKVYIAEPNQVIDHKFIEVQIVSEITNDSNRTIVLKQMAIVARDAREIYGPNSGIDIIGNKNGVLDYLVSMLPYDDKVTGYG